MLTLSGFRLRSFVQSALCHIRETLDFAAVHPTKLLRERAAASAADFVTAHMPHVLSFYTAKEVLWHCLARLPGEGQILEFGVFRGGTIGYMARTRPEREIHGFDTFEGLPAGWPGMGYDAGAFSAGGRVPRVARNVRLHKGLFDVTLPAWIAENDRPVALIHIDCDLYSSTRTVFDLLRDRITPGLIIVFDEYFGYPGWERGEHRAFCDLIRDTGLGFEYLCHARQQVAVRMLHAVGEPDAAPGAADHGVAGPEFGAAAGRLIPINAPGDAAIYTRHVRVGDDAMARRDVTFGAPAYSTTGTAGGGSVAATATERCRKRV